MTIDYTKGVAGRSEKLIGKYAKKESGNLDDLSLDKYTIIWYYNSISDSLIIKKER